MGVMWAAKLVRDGLENETGAEGRARGSKCLC
jgi:hypothetical protein